MAVHMNDLASGFVLEFSIGIWLIIGLWPRVLVWNRTWLRFLFRTVLTMGGYPQSRFEYPLSRPEAEHRFVPIVLPKIAKKKKKKPTVLSTLKMSKVCWEKRSPAFSPNVLMAFLSCKYSYSQAVWKIWQQCWAWRGARNLVKSWCLSA